ncbi:MAG: metal ABC transporter permease [Verrucomicrobia bacterium]|jgi:zinc/manganese transport system permease protein|nr:metal ABC transporter permease [Verrucomicrobiota bacterium]
MHEAFEIMLRPLVACLVLPGILVYYGLHIVRRGVIFVDLALAQVATLGTCVCLVLGHEPDDPHNYFWSLGFTLAGAIIFTFTRQGRGGRVPQEAIIGIVYVVAAAAGILLLSHSPHGKEELQKTLVGDLLTVSWMEIWRTAVLFLLIGIVHFIFRRRFIALSFGTDQSFGTLWAQRWWDFLFYALFGLVVTSFVQVGGVLLVFSYLIVPAVCGNYLAATLAGGMAVGWTVATAASVGGLYASYQLDLPTGAAIVCALGVAMVLGVILSRFRRPLGASQ